MPVHTGKDSRGCYAQWGSKKKYYYTCGNASARSRAKAKATAQGRAAHASGYRGNKGVDMKKPRMIVANFTGVVRHDTMEGRDYLVAPMVMIVEGVLPGSEGPLLYPAEELGKTPQVWNHKPVVVYHPQANGVGVSACDPEVLTNRKVGVIMNTAFEDGKLKAEAWMEKSRMDTVDDRIAEAIENQEMMELSTGVFTDNEEIEGEFNGIHYDAIARNYRPDHLALLPDKLGACSIEDGAGFLRLNEMGYGAVRSLLSSALRDAKDDAWIEEVYDDFFIYEDDGKLFKQSYEEDSGKVTITGEAEEVVRVIEYRTMLGTFIANYNGKLVNLRKDNTMKRKEKVDNLISDKTTKWDEGDRKTLMGISESVLDKIIPVVNEEEAAVDEAARRGAGDGGDVSAPETPAETPAEENPVESPTENQAQPAKTVDEYINQAPKDMQGVLRNGLSSYNASKARLIKVITANEKNTFTEEQLKAKDLSELQALAKLAAQSPKEDELVQNYDGQLDAAEMEEHEEKPMDTPKMNFGKDESTAEAA